MDIPDTSRRRLLKDAGAAGLMMLSVAGPMEVLGQVGEQVIPWLDPPPPNPIPNVVGNLLNWEALGSRPVANGMEIQHKT